MKNGKRTAMTIFLQSIVFLAAVLFSSRGDSAVGFGRYYGKEAALAGMNVEAVFPDGLRQNLEKTSRGHFRGTNPIRYPFPGGSWNVPEGSIVLYIKRATDPPTKKNAEYDTLFSLLDSNGTQVMTAYLLWDVSVSRAGQYGAGINIYSEVAPKTVWGFWIPLDRKIEPGETFRLAFAWGGGGNRVYLNGSPLTSVYSDFDGKQPVSPETPFAAYLSAVRDLQVGADPFEGDNSPIDASVLLGIEVHDRIVQDPRPWALDAGVRSIVDDSFRVAGISGKLVAGDQVNVELKASPGGAASFDMGNVKGIALTEVPPTEAGPGVAAVDNGTYRGAYTIKPGDDYENGQIVGHFVSSDNVAADNMTSASKWTIDTKPVVVFAIDRKDLPADSASKARIKLVAKDANGNPVKERHLKLTLATTDEYTGTVGAGDFGKEVGATVETRWKGETDSWGEVEFDYTAGFAAKTVILTSKDLDSGGVTVDYVTAFKEASIDIALTPPVNRAAARRGMTFILKVEASRTELTADGRSRSVVRATLLDPNGTPVAGDPVAFALSGPNGTLRTVAGTTNSSGTATADYTAGKKIGIVVVTATATLRNATGNVSILLLSDAPAKIYLKVRPETLPADGISRADIQVKVTDVNDNPNRDTKVDFRIAKGGGKLEYADRSTDRFGDAQNRYTAGTAAGIASVVATVRSRIPTEAELSKARNVLFVPYLAEGEEIRVEKWLKKKGDAVLRGEPVIGYTVGRDRTVRTLAAPYDGTMGETFVEYWDNAEVGQTLGVLIPSAR